MIGALAFPLTLITLPALKPEDSILVTYGFVLTIMIIWTHRKNILRLFKGQENKTYLIPGNQLGVKHPNNLTFIFKSLPIFHNLAAHKFNTKMSALAYSQEHKGRFLDELIELLKIPSVSADSRHKEDVARAADYIRQKLQDAGAEMAEICPTPGHPIVYGEKIIDPGKPTVIVYGHYDVQPPDPLNLWDSPPFEPVIKNEKIYARGASDDKGQMYMHIKTFESLIKTNSLPCNIKFMIEGEEEVGSNHLEVFVRDNKDRLQGDIILISDTGIISNENPSLTVGLRGLSYMEVEVTGPNRDLHSGVYGGAVENPLNVLCQMITSMKDANGHITIPGFYDDVIELSDEDRRKLNQAPFDLEEYKNDLGVGDVFGEKGYTTLERTGIRPTLDVNGIYGGYTGEGAKTVLPSKASAKISMRLVPGQDSKKISDLFTQHFNSIAPDTVQVKVTPHHGGEPAMLSTSSIGYQAAAKAMEKAWGKEPIPTKEGGSIPIVALFQDVLGLDSILLGVGLDSDNIHSPNENFGLYNYYKGIETLIGFHKHFAEMAG